jgi:hypothetical protein
MSNEQFDRAWNAKWRNNYMHWRINKKAAMFPCSDGESKNGIGTDVKSEVTCPVCKEWLDELHGKDKPSTYGGNGYRHKRKSFSSFGYYLCDPEVYHGDGLGMDVWKNEFHSVNCPECLKFKRQEDEPEDQDPEFEQRKGVAVFLDHETCEMLEALIGPTPGGGGVLSKLYDLLYKHGYTNLKRRLKTTGDTRLGDEIWNQ